jgi:outer membrane protein OmpA-like peptidoglycan-associated protein
MIPGEPMTNTQSARCNGTILPYPRACALAATLWALTLGCVPPPPPATPQPPPGELNLTGAVQSVANDLARQLGPAADGSRVVVIDPLLDGKTGQQTGASNKVQQQVTIALPIVMKSVKVIPFDAGGAAQAGGVIAGTVTALGPPDTYRLSIALSDRQSGLVVAQAVAPFREAGLDSSPTKFYGDSPSLVRDRSVDGYLKTAETPAGKPADPLYIDQVPTAAVLADALAAYNSEHWSQALALYKAAAQRPDGQQLRTFNGIYLVNVQLGLLKDAEEAFSKIAALGLATNNLAVKILFRPGTTEFWSDPKVTAVYPMWLRQIAKAAQGSGSCLNVIGHTSRSGPEQINDRLSLSRATAIRDKLASSAPALTPKLRVSGLGYRENLVGTGADDASDALDRRVEFKVMSCTAPLPSAPPPAAAPAPAPAPTYWAPPPASGAPGPAGSAPAQYPPPSQYPPSQYPPSQYPPSQYPPPAQSPPAQYPPAAPAQRAPAAPPPGQSPPPAGQPGAPSAPPRS